MKFTNELNEFAINIINTVREPLLVLDKNLRVIKASRSFYNFFKVTSDETIGVLIYELGNNQWNIPKLRELLETILPEKTTFDDYEVEHDFSTIGKRIMLLNARQIKRAFGKEKVILLAIEDITERKHAEESLSETSRMTSEYLDILVNHAHVPIIIWDASYVITRFNHAFEKLSGYDISEVIGRKIDFLFPEDKVNSTIELLKNYFGEEKFEVIEIDILRKDKYIRTVLWNSANVFDKEGRIIVATIAQDITNHKKMVNDLLKLSRAVEQSPLSIIITDIKGNIEYVNPKVTDITGYHFTELQGKNPRIFSSGEKSDNDYKILWDTINSGKEWRGEFHNKKKNGELYWESASISSIRNNNEEITHYLAVKEDITERKLVERELIEAKERAEQSDKLKSEFLAQMSHEIRTPLGTIVGNVELLSDSFHKEISPDTLNCFDDIDIATKRIIRTIDLLLNAAELQTSDYKPNFIKVDLNSQIFAKLFQEHQPAAKQKGLEFIYKCELKETITLADEYSVYQIFVNLIDNAIKYTKKGKVEILLEKNRAGNIIAEIKDTGIGISKEFLPRLFDSFAQEEQGYTRKFDGNGLGLSLVKKYCGLNNAVVEVESEKKVGSTFRIIFV